jgi:phospholipase/carboxylesterase
VRGELDPHAGGKVYTEGVRLEEAAGVVILLHGRGGSAEDILSLAGGLSGPERQLAFLSPQAAGYTWYPHSFLAERESNEPWVSSALRKVESVVKLAVASGISRERIVVGGFSQGACLATEFIATHPARYAGLIAWTGGLIGPLGSDISHTGGLGGMAALQSAGDPDPHVPWSRVEESGKVALARHLIEGAFLDNRV